MNPIEKDNKDMLGYSTVIFWFWGNDDASKPPTMSTL